MICRLVGVALHAFMRVSVGYEYPFEPLQLSGFDLDDMYSREKERHL